MSSFGVWHVLGLVVLVLLLWAFISIFGRILSRAGYSRWWLLVMLVPLVNLVMVWVFAFANWPVQARPQVTGS